MYIGRHLIFVHQSKETSVF